jgi:hypothetical protein
MELIDHPAVPPEDVPATLANFANWPLAKYEASYAERPGHYSAAGYRIVAEALAEALVPLATQEDGPRHDHP